MHFTISNNQMVRLKTLQYIKFVAIEQNLPAAKGAHVCKYEMCGEF